MARRAVVTGAYSYMGAAVARELHARGWQVETLTNRLPPTGVTHVPSFALSFTSEHLERVLRGADAFVNTYWIRFPHAGQNFMTAVENSRKLVAASRNAGVRRLVHVSVSNARPDSLLGYYRGKALVEEAVRAVGVSFGIVRPTLVIGPRDVLTSNIAWLLRRFPVFPLPGGGCCRLQPITLGDTARIVANAVESNENLEVDAAGPDTLSFRRYVELVAHACGVRRFIVCAPRWLAFAALRLIEFWLKDIILTREELDGLEQELLVSHAAPLGQQSVAGWLDEHGATLGQTYVNDRLRHFGYQRTEPILIP